VKKMKNDSFRLNDNIKFESYKSWLEYVSVPIKGTNRGLMVVESDPHIGKRRKKQ
jgi:hypothetical protein